MSLTRKQFFRQALLSIGKTAVEVSHTLDGSSDRTAAEPCGDSEELERQAPPEADPDKVAAADNGRCLARSCGCFSCIERCEIEAISVLPGVGIKIDEARCTGCGACEYVCPIFPKAVKMQPRAKENANVPAASAGGDIGITV